MTHQHTVDQDLEAYWKARDFDEESPTFELMKASYLNLNDKWRGQLVIILCDLATELITEDFTVETENRIYDYFLLKPENIEVQDIKQLFEWIKK